MINYDLVVVGGGSGGIAAAVSAAENGVKSILLIEKEKFLGGILLQCIHNGFGLETYKEELTGPSYVARAESELQGKNIEIKLNTMVTEITQNLEVTFSNDIDGIVTVKAKAIICATGCSERTRGQIAIPGERPSGIMTAGIAQKYLNIEGYLVGKRVFILGSGDIGLIMARRMTLEGAKVLGVAEIMPYSSGLNRNIVQCLQDFDIPLYLSHTVKDIIGTKRVEKIVISQVDEKFNYIEGTEKEFSVDTLLLSVGLVPYNPLLENIGVKMHAKTRGPIVDESYQTSIKGIFACGNSLHVHDLVDFVSKEGKKAGIAVAKYLAKELENNNTINTIAGNGISYVLPSVVNLDNIEEINLFFRVTAPHKTSKILIYSGNKLIKEFRKTYLVPSEMENIMIKTDLIHEDLKLEVIDA